MAEVQMPSEAQLRSAMESIIVAKDPSQFTLGTLRGALETHFDLQGGSLDHMADAIKAIATDLMKQPAQAHDEAEEEIIFPKIMERFLSIVPYPSIPPAWESCSRLTFGLGAPTPPENDHRKVMRSMAPSPPPDKFQIRFHDP